MPSLLTEVPLSPDDAQYALMSFNMPLSSRPSGLLIGSFSPLINSVRAGCVKPSINKHSSIDPYLKQLTYPSVYVSMHIKAVKEECVKPLPLFNILKAVFNKCMILSMRNTKFHASVVKKLFVLFYFFYKHIYFLPLYFAGTKTFSKVIHE